MKQETKFKQTKFGQIPEDWLISTIGSFCLVKNGKTNTQDAIVNGKYPLFDRSSEIKRSNKFLFDSESVIIPGEGKEFIPKYYLGKFDLHQRVYAINTNSVDKIDIKYIYYYVHLNREYLARIAVGATVKSLRLDHLINFPLAIPTLKEQKTIVKILSDLDEKIELNQQMNKTLEEIGKTLFKRWFVDFEFPNEQGIPYKSSGGEMVYNEELKKEIPNGSQIIRLKDQLTFERGIEPGSAIYENSKTENNIRFIRVSDLNNDNSTTFIPLELATSKVIESDVLLSLDASVGIVRIGYNGSFSSGIRKIYDNCNKLSNALIYFLLKSEDIQNTINQYANGTTILHAGKSIEFMNFVIPNEKMLDKFKTQITPIFNQILYNIKENKQLADTRDLLLPKLMSGKIRVKY